MPEIRTQECAQVPDVPSNSARPTPRRARIDLKTIKHARVQMSRLFKDARLGFLSTTDAAKLAYVLHLFARLVETSELEERVTALEALRAHQ